MKIQRIEFGLPGVLQPSVDVLLKKAAMMESISHSFHATMELTVNNLSPTQLSLYGWLGHQAMLRCFTDTSEHIQRNYVGVVKQLSSQINTFGQVTALRLTLDVWPNGAGRNVFLKNYRFFQDKTSIEMAKMVFEAAGGDVDLSGVVTQPEKRSYEVQYDESDAEFVFRILSEDGFLYRMVYPTAYGLDQAFPRVQAQPLLKIYSSLSTIALVPDDVLINTPNQTSQLGLRSGIFNMSQNLTQAPDTVALASAQSSLPNVDLRVQIHQDRAAQEGLRANWIEIHADQNFTTSDQGRAKASKLLDSSMTPSYQFGCDLLTLEVAEKYSLKHNLSDTQPQYVVILQSEQWIESDHFHGYLIWGQAVCKRSVLATDHHCVTPPSRSRLPGLLRGVVVDLRQEPAYASSSNDSTRHVDEWGRIKVRILWHSQTRSDEALVTDSPWLRLITPWAGQKAGFIALPRAGQEVIVSFIHGDPAQPVVLGCLYGESSVEPSEPAWQMPNDQRWVGIATHPQTANSPGQFLRLDSERSPTKGIEMHAEHSIDIQAKTDVLLKAIERDVSVTAPESAVFINAKKSIELSATKLNFIGKTNDNKSTDEWRTNIGKTKSTYHLKFDTGAFSSDVWAVKNSNVGVSNTNIGAAVNTFGTKNDFIGFKSDVCFFKDDIYSIKQENGVIKKKESVTELDTKLTAIKTSISDLKTSIFDVSTNGLTTIL
jgi:type VI secretion system secreted protein VgrG